MNIRAHQNSNSKNIRVSESKRASDWIDECEWVSEWVSERASENRRSRKTRIYQTLCCFRQLLRGRPKYVRFVKEVLQTRTERAIRVGRLERRCQTVSVLSKYEHLPFDGASISERFARPFCWKTIKKKKLKTNLIEQPIHLSSFPSLACFFLLIFHHSTPSNENLTKCPIQTHPRANLRPTAPNHKTNEQNILALLEKQKQQLKRKTKLRAAHPSSNRFACPHQE